MCHNLRFSVVLPVAILATWIVSLPQDIYQLSKMCYGLEFLQLVS